MDNTPSSLNGEKNPFAELTGLGGAWVNTQTKRSFRPSLLGTAFVLRIVATIVVGLSAIFALDAFVRSSETKPAFIPSSLHGYLAIGIKWEPNEGGLTLKWLSAQYAADTQELLDLYGNSVTNVTYQRSLVEFFEKNPEVEFIKTQNDTKYNILTIIDEFARMTRSRDEYAHIVQDCQIESVSDSGMIKANCDIYSSLSSFAPGIKSARVVAAELLESFGSKESKFILKNTPKSLAITEVSERAFKSKTSVSLELQALPALLP